MQAEKGPEPVIQGQTEAGWGEAAASGTIWHQLPAASDQPVAVSSVGAPCALPQEEHPAPGPIFSWGLWQCLCCVGPRADNGARARPPQTFKPPATFPVVLLMGKEFFHHPLHGFVLTAMCPQRLRAEPVPRSGWSCGGLKLHLRMESHRLGPARWEG